MTADPVIGSLCSGAGMLDEGVRSVLGGTVAWHAETDPAASRVLAHRYPGVPNLGDLTTVDWSGVEPVDALCAGYPCQPDSLAGKGLSTDDHRWIFPDIARAVGVLRPGLIVLENVPGHFVRGFRTVLGSLTELGYDAVWTLVRASDVGAPHRRERLFVAAWPAALADRVGCAGWTEADSQRWTNGSGPRRAIARPRTDAATDADLARREGAESAWRRDLPARGTSADANRDAVRQQPIGQRRGSGQAVAGRARADAWGPGEYDCPGCGDSLGEHHYPGYTCPLADTNDDSARNGREPGDASGRGAESAQRGATTADTARDGRNEGRPEPARLIGGPDAAERGPVATDADGRRREVSPELDSHATPHATNRRPRGRHTDGHPRTDWGVYEPAIRRWEHTLGRPAPAPTEPGPRGGQRLSPRLTEWMMGWPDGWVTDVPGISRNDALRICGNGVVPQQCAEALRRLLPHVNAERAA